MTACAVPPHPDRKKHDLMSLDIKSLSSLIGAQNCLNDKDAMQPFLQEWRGRMKGNALAVMLPQNTQQVAEIVKFCAANRIALTPQGGNTGLTGASVPEEAQSIVLSLKRMSRIRAIRADDFSMEVDAGCILQKAKEEAAAQNRLLAMTLASEGSATIGGLIATNAGGSFTLKYGNMREQVLGLEVVLPDGAIWNGLRSLRKNNSGYDLKQLFIGSEGTLGVITAATLRLLPAANAINTALVALASAADAIALLGFLREETQETIAAFELIPSLAIDTFCHKTKAQPAPFAQDYPWLALVETHDQVENTRLSTALETALEKKRILDATMAQTEGQKKAFWQLREGIVEAQKSLGPSLKHDLAAPIHAIPALINNGSAAVEKIMAGARPYVFGHIGDGNIHFNISPPEGMKADIFSAARENIAAALHDAALALGGSLSAEHGIGRFKRDEFHRTVNRTEFETMRSIKHALDPENIMNPGVLF